MRILAFGEILWDIFGDEKKIGGAPFNFGAHMSKLGAESYLVSAVGRDENGFDAIQQAKAFGIKTEYISPMSDFKTGACNITLKNGLPQYEILQDVAFDHIPEHRPMGRFDALYMGTLAMRGNVSKKSFEKLLAFLKSGNNLKEVLFDVNFRGSFYNRDTVNMLMKETTILKVSDEEIGFFGKRGHIDTCIELGKKYPKLKYICLTLGKDGAAVYDCKRRKMFFSDIPKGRVVSTVGAGDSFAAGFLYFLLSGYRIEECLDKAVILSDFVVGHLEAVPDYSPKDLL